MKKCTYCGREYSDDAVACAVDAQPLAHVAQEPNAEKPKPSKRTEQLSYGRTRTTYSSSVPQPSESSRSARPSPAVAMLMLILIRLASGAAWLGIAAILITGVANILSGENVIPHTLAYFGGALAIPGVLILGVIRVITDHKKW